MHRTNTDENGDFEVQFKAMSASSTPVPFGFKRSERIEIKNVLWGGLAVLGTI